MQTVTLPLEMSTAAPQSSGGGQAGKSPEKGKSPQKEKGGGREEPAILLRTASGKSAILDGYVLSAEAQEREL